MSSSSPAQDALTFRDILQAASRPGTIAKMRAPRAAVAPLSRSAMSVLTTMCDYQSPIWFSQSFASPEVLATIKFETGTPIVGDRAAAHFAVASVAEFEASLDEFARGTHTYPDRSATLIVETSSLRRGPQVELSGPGVNGRAHLAIPEAGAEFWRQLIEANSDFPLGHDLFFTCEDEIVCCPRSAKIGILEVS